MSSVLSAITSTPRLTILLAVSLIVALHIFYIQSSLWASPQQQALQQQEPSLLYPSTTTSQKAVPSVASVPSLGHVRPRIVVSLSTFGHRSSKIHNTIKTIYNQSRRPDAMYLHIPEKIERIQAGAADATIVNELVAEYDGWLIVTHPKITDQAPNFSALSSSKKIPKPSSSQDTQSILGRKTFVMDGERICWHGISVGYFEENVFNYTGVPDGCKLHDDVYLSGVARRLGFRPYVIYPGFEPITGTQGHSNLSINAVPNTEAGYRNPCIEYFNYFKG
ncbi:hypothetical protein BC829DRAFT_430566 [Chytridium lagenaria]|nr:hypothetical protein BC829DRAFT_430566 [Chytridium lagenaria]